MTYREYDISDLVSVGSVNVCKMIVSNIVPTAMSASNNLSLTRISPKCA